MHSPTMRKYAEVCGVLDVRCSDSRDLSGRMVRCNEKGDWVLGSLQSRSPRCLALGSVVPDGFCLEVVRQWVDCAAGKQAPYKARILASFSIQWLSSLLQNAWIPGYEAGGNELCWIST